MRQQSINRTLTVLLLAVAITTSASLALPQATTSKPSPAPAKWLPLIGEYVRDSETVIILESEGKLSALFKGHGLLPLQEVSKDSFEFDITTGRQGEQVIFSRDAHGHVTQVTLGREAF